MRTEQFETVVVGGAQAGLAVGYHLKQRDRECVILDAHERIGDSWRNRWPSLRLYSPAGYDGLPGMRFPGKRTSYPTAYEMADYLESYATVLDLPVRTGVAVEELSREDGRFVLTAGDRRFEAENVVVATGVFPVPVTPDFAGELDPRIRQLHSDDYRSPAQMQDGAVLVVGASHSGSDIAHEVVRAGHPTVLSGRHNGELPAAIDGFRGRSIFRGLFFVGTRVLTVDTPMGRKMRAKVRSHGGPLLRIRSSDLAAAGVERVLERTVGVEDGRPVLEDGRVLDVANVVWCTGFRSDYSWITFPLELGDDGYPVQYKGVAASQPGLYFVGLPYLHSFGSMLIGGAGRDAARVAKHIALGGSEERMSAPAQAGRAAEGEIAA
jgi:putative flavoprotein involved in K+ transport